MWFICVPLIEEVYYFQLAKLLHNENMRTALISVLYINNKYLLIAVVIYIERSTQHFDKHFEIIILFDHTQYINFSKMLCLRIN